MEELKQRLEKTIENLTVTLDYWKNDAYRDQYCQDEVERLTAKISGVQLALRYVEEKIREDEDEYAWMCNCLRYIRKRESE